MDFKLVQYACGLRVWVQESAVPTVWPLGAAKEQQVQNICTCTPRLTSRGARKFLVDLHAAARATCHVPPADPRQAPWSFRRFTGRVDRQNSLFAPGACSWHPTGTATPVPIGPAVRALYPEMLEQTYRLTNTIRPTFFQRPTGGNLRS